MTRLVRFMMYPPGMESAPVARSQAEFEELKKLNLSLGTAYAEEANQVRCAPDHPGLPVILDRLKKNGWLPITA